MEVNNENEMNQNNKLLNTHDKPNVTKPNYANTYPEYFWDLFGIGNDLGFDEEPEDLPPTPNNSNPSV